MPKTFYRAGDVAAARRYVNAQFRAGKVASKASKTPSKWSDAYMLRVANKWRRASIDKQPLSLQIGRGHAAPDINPVTGRTIGLARSGIRSTEHRKTVHRGQFDELPPYRRAAALKARIMREPFAPGQMVVLSAYGTITSGYSESTKGKFGDSGKAWRNVWYGRVEDVSEAIDFLSGKMDRNDPDAADEYRENWQDDFPGLNAFEHIELWEMRWR